MKNFLIAVLTVLLPLFVWPQKLENSQIAQLISQYKADAKGPYKDIRWFCKDGSTRPPQERCPEPGFQRARYKDEVIRLAETNHIFLGQILSTTPFEAFLDKGHNHSRLKQYLLERYLVRTNNGWILQKAQYYRGAFQAEDEEMWGIDFFNWVLKNESLSKKNYCLLREAARDLPHQGDDNRTQLVRALSKELSDSLPEFMNIRVKIHGNPGKEDIRAVQKFKEAHGGKMSASQLKKTDELIRNMEIVFQPADLSSMKKQLKQLPRESAPYQSIQYLINHYSAMSPGKERVAVLSESLLKLRQALSSELSSSAQLAVLDASLKLEEMLFREMDQWPDKTLNDLLLKINYLGMASAGCGYIEWWEWNELSHQIYMLDQKTLTLNDLNQLLASARRMVEWSTGMLRATFKDVVDLYLPFEPKALGFLDDRIRSSLLLPLGNCVSNLATFIADEADFSNQLMNIKSKGNIRGINPGYAMGELIVLDEISDKTEIFSDKIYVIEHPPADLKPVAGIATVTEGNLVSHVQLLARNLGIPNAVLSSENLEMLKPFSGQKVFYAVSNKGTVILKPADQMTENEKKLFSTKKQPESRIRVPNEKIDLKQTKILNLRNVQAMHSGILCGPKAANLGQLKMLFPDHVVEGLVIPFGIFRQHMEQKIPGSERSYWDFLKDIFKEAENMRAQGKPEADTDKFTLQQLETLRGLIKEMPLNSEFVAELELQFSQIFGKDMGEVPVFLRSDTNMEDLKDFTGAGLNLTLFNVLDREKIWQGIKDVWASPYAERSYKWRQKLLLNPQDVYPSILVIPGVNVECSGVLITKGIQTDEPEGLTIAFSRGVGGAVEGQVAESYLFSPDGTMILLSPSREPLFTALKSTGGTERMQTSFEKPVLTEQNLDQLKLFAEKIKTKIPQYEPGNTGPYDIELGFKENKIWLFQIRPFVENKNAKASAYLESITPKLSEKKVFDINQSL